jgi:flagellar hook protein FlgE
MASGEPVIGSPGEEGFGKIFQGYLEDSNVDLAQEQVNLIIDQRTFEANVNIVKTADQIMKTIIDIKR